MVKNNEDMSKIGNDLQLMFYLVAGFTTVLAILICLCKNLSNFYLIINDYGVNIIILFYHYFFLSILLVFQKAPPTPPSASAALCEQPKTIQSFPFLHSIKNLSFNLNYILLLISYGINGKLN